MLQSHSRSLIKRRSFTNSTLKKVMASSTASAVQHDTKSKKFVMHLENGDAVLEYRLKDPSIIEMYHTEVPKAYRGQGIAQKLVAEALQFTMENKLTVQPTCSYVSHYLEKNPEVFHGLSYDQYKNLK